MNYLKLTCLLKGSNGETFEVFTYVCSLKMHRDRVPNLQNCDQVRGCYSLTKYFLIESNICKCSTIISNKFSLPFVEVCLQDCLGCRSYRVKILYESRDQVLSQTLLARPFGLLTRCPTFRKYL